MKKEKENKVNVVPKNESGLSDCVELYANANVTVFQKDGRQAYRIAGGKTVKCRMMASYESGIVSISLRGDAPLMVSVRLDEMMELLKEAAAARINARRENSES